MALESCSVIIFYQSRVVVAVITAVLLKIGKPGLLGQVRRDKVSKDK